VTLRRGDIVTVAARGTYAGKPRPAIVIQESLTLPLRDSVTLCLLTTGLIDAPLFRVRIQPSTSNGLRHPSDVMADKVLTVPRSSVSERLVGRLGRDDLERVSEALRFWLGL
jgi:mRNA interferase MazF